jgi:alpha-L-rhamnosidase
MIDLSPAKWVWLPSQRCLPNTFVLFRRALPIAKDIKHARGWVTADSRYWLSVNGRRLQYGPAPCDPRWQDADAIDLTAHLDRGDNVIGAQVLYYGTGDGTWPMGSPGFIFKLEIAYADGTSELLISDAAWQARLDRAHTPGIYKQWYLRALTEEFDARLHPHDWDTPAHTLDAAWLPARELPGSAALPATFAGGPEYVLASDMPSNLTAKVMGPNRSAYGLVERSIPPMREVIVPARRMTDCGRVTWKRDPRDWFESRIPDAFDIALDPQIATVDADGAGWRAPGTPPNTGWFATFVFNEQIVGWPRITVDAPAGTIIELMTQESHDAGRTLWLDSHFYHWARFTCAEGRNVFEAAEWESLRWVQLHIREASGPVHIHSVDVRRRSFPWPNTASIKCAEPALQRLFEATINTLDNSAIETLMDGAGRERQQYAGDCGHQAHAIRYAFGETGLPARYLRTFSQGMTHAGFFLDTWPAFDRLARIMQRELGMTQWGPILDHGLQFISDCWYHYLETGDLDALREPYPRLVRFLDYLGKIVGPDDLLPVEDIGVPTVWIDHDAYQQQRHKQCAFNLNTVAALRHLARIAPAFDDTATAERATALADALLSATRARFWDAESKLFVVNKPWLGSEGEAHPRTCDRSLALAVLFDLADDVSECVWYLAETPASMGLSYPANAGWRLRALMKAGRVDVVLREFRELWAQLDSVLQNNTLQEMWQLTPDTVGEYSHCPVAPVYILMQDVLGLKAQSPGFRHYELRPQLGDIGALDVTMHTPQGPVRVVTEPLDEGGQRITVHPARAGIGTLWIGERMIELRPGEVSTEEISVAKAAHGEHFA